MRLTTLIMTLALALTACGKKEEAPKPTPGSGSAVVADPGSGSADPGSAAGSAVAADPGAGSAAEAVEIPTAADFEADAESAITEGNVEQELKTLEASLGDA